MATCRSRQGTARMMESRPDADRHGIVPGSLDHRPDTPHPEALRGSRVIGEHDLELFPSGFRLQVNRMTQEHPSGLLLTASGIQHRVPRRTVSKQTAFDWTDPQ